MIQMKEILPRKFQGQQFEKYFSTVLSRTVEAADKEFGKTYATWKHKPEFVRVFTRLVGSVSTSDQIYVWVSEGTRGPYRIPREGTALLVFQAGYQPKTIPHLVYSRSGGPFGPTIFVRGPVMHPGIKEPRKFDKTVAAYVRPWFTKWTNDALKQAARASGHGR